MKTSSIIKAAKLTCLAITLVFSSCNKPIKNTATLFKDVNIINMVNDSILQKHSVLVKDRKIVHIGIFEEMDIPSGAQVINGKGQFLIPGLCDMHVHFGDDDDRKLYVANGVTFIRNMWGSPSHLSTKEMIDKKRLVGPELNTTGPIIDGLNPIWPRSFVINDKSKVREALTQMKKDGYAAIKVYEKLTKEVYDEIIKVAKELDIPVVGHVPLSMQIKDVIAAGQYSIEHFDGYENHFDNDEIIAQTIKSGVWNCPTLVCVRNFEKLDSLRKNPPSEMKYVSQYSINFWKNTPQFDMKYGKKKQLLKTLSDKNGNLVTGTDITNPYTIAGFSLHEELVIWQNAGLRPYQILLAATKNSAKMAGYESRLGTIEKNKDADLVLLKNNPLEDIKHTKSIEGVMTKGSWYSKTALHSMLNEVASKKERLRQKSTIQNSSFIKWLTMVMALVFLSTFVIRPTLYVFNRNKLKSLISADKDIKTYRIRFLVISISVISLIILFLIVTVAGGLIQQGLPEILPNDILQRCQLLTPFVNLIFVAVLSILYSILLVKKKLSTFRKWHTLSIILASTILFVLLNYWELLRLY